MVEYTSIKVRKPTYEKLRELAKYGDSMDSVISECVETLKKRGRS